MGCHAFISPNAPSVHTTVSVTVKPNHAGEVHGTINAATLGAVAPANTANTSAHMSNLLLLMAERMGVETDKFGDSNKVIDL